MTIALPLAVLPAKAGIHFHLAPSQDCLDSARCRSRATFVSAKVAKTIALGTTVETTSCCLDFPAHLAPSGPARTHTSVCSNSRALLPLGAAVLGVMRRR